MMANLEMLTSLSNAKRLLTEVAVTKYVICLLQIIFSQQHHAIVLEYDMLSHVNQIFAITVSAKGLLIKCIPLTLTPGQFFLLLTSFDKPPAHNVEK